MLTDVSFLVTCNFSGSYVQGIASQSSTMKPLVAPTLLLADNLIFQALPDTLATTLSAIWLQAATSAPPSLDLRL